MSVLWTDLTIEALAAAGDRPVTRSLEDLPADPMSGAASGTRMLDKAAGAVTLLDELRCPSEVAVPMLASTSPDAQAMLLGGAVSSRPLAPLGPKLTPREIARCVGDLGAGVLLSQTAYADNAKRAAEIAGVGLEIVDGVPEADGAAVRPLGRDAVVAYLHTSGTTGAPKSVPLTNRQLGARTALLREACGYDGTSVVAAASGFHHIAGLGMVLVAMACGSAIVAFPQFSLQNWRLLRPLGPTHAALVSTFIEMLVAQDEFDIESLRCVTYGASPIRVSTLRAVLDARPDIDFIRWYGQTEGSPISWLSPGDHVRAVRQDQAWMFDTVGRALPGVELMIDGPDANGVGEVCARGEHLAVVDAEGWRHTGDLGSLDEQGFLSLAGRTGDMIIRGGENVYPAEIERVLASHPKVADALVVGLPDDILGERIKAIVQPVDPADSPTAEQLRGYARERLAGFKVPADWEFCEQFRRNASGKILRSSYLRV